MIDNTEIQHIYQTPTPFQVFCQRLSDLFLNPHSKAARQRNITTCFARKPKLKLRGVITAHKVSEDKARYFSSGLSALFTVDSRDNDDIKRIKQKDGICIISSYSSKESRNVLISVTTLSLKGKKNNLTKCTKDILLIRNNQLLTQY